MTAEEAKARAMALIAVIIMIGLIGVLGLTAMWLIANSFRRYHKARNKPTSFVDAWSAAGERAAPPPQDRPEESDEPDQRP
jgi:hypothetical protein